MLIEELIDINRQAYDAFVNKLIEDCHDEFVVLEDGRIVNADRPDGTVIVYEDGEWVDTTEDFDGEE